jgi:hypothetical protein
MCCTCVINKNESWLNWGQGELAGTLVLTVNTQLLEIVYFGNLTPNTIIELAQWNSIFN